MLKGHMLTKKLIVLFVIMLLSIIIMTGVSSYAAQMAVQKEDAEQNLQNLVKYLVDIMENDKEEFIAYQKLSLKVSDKVNIPVDFDGDYHAAKIDFYEAFSNEYPGKSLGADIGYEEMSEELQVLYVTYKHEYWLHVFNETRDNFGVAYTYYVVPTGEELYMYYMIDALRDAREDGYLLLNLDVYQDLETHSHMWQAWENASYTPGYDIQDNEYGKTYICYYPLVINGEELGVVCADLFIEDVNKAILNNSIRQMIRMAVLIVPIILFISYWIGTRYIRRLVDLKKDVSDFSVSKEPSIGDRIIKDTKGNDEISDLANEIADMASELGNYMNTLVEKNNELMEAQEKIRVANELANKDALTGIRNKTAYDFEVKRVEDRMGFGDTKVGIAVVDLNFLKKINDTYGHEKGNISIKKLCFVVCHIFQHSPVFRIGGDEFAILLFKDDYDNYDSLYAEFYRQLDEMEKDDSLEPWEKISAAIGVAYYDPSIDKSVEDMFKRADANMYARKKEMKAARED